MIVPIGDDVQRKSHTLLLADSVGGVYLLCAKLPPRLPAGELGPGPVLLHLHCADHQSGNFLVVSYSKEGVHAQTVQV